MSSLLLQVILYVVGAVAGIWFGLHSAKDAFTLRSSSTTTMLGDGKEKEKEKAKILEKERAKDPINSNTANGGNSPAINTAYTQPQLPDMRGVDYANSGNMPPASGMGRGFGVTAVVGVVNGIGAVVQGGEVRNKFAAARQIIGPVRQTGMVYNMKPKGTKSIQQAGSNIFNTISHGRLTMSQNAKGIRTSIAEGRTDVKPLGNSSNYISGDVKSIKAGQGDIYTPNLRIKAVSKVGSLSAQNFTAPKKIRKKIQKLNHTNPLLVQKGSTFTNTNTNSNINSTTKINNYNQEVLRAGASEQKALSDNTGTGKNEGRERRPNVVINLNTVNLLSSGNRRYVNSTEGATKTLSLEQAFGEAQNGGFSNEQLITLAAVYRAVNKIAVSGNGNYQNVLKQITQADHSSYQSVVQQVIQERPDLKDPEQIIWTAYRAPQLVEQGPKQRRQSVAAFMTNKKNVQKDLQAQNINYLNGIIRNDGVAATQFQHVVEENYRKNVEQRAKENIEKRADMSLEEKEKEYEKEVKKLLGSGNEEEKKIIEEHIKEQVLANPEEAKRVIGGKAASDLKEHMEQEEKKVYQRNIEKQEKAADNEFVKKHPEHKEDGAEQVREARRKDEMREAINKAVSEMYAQMKKGQEQEKNEKDKQRDRKIRSFEEYRERREQQDKQYNANIQGNIPQPTGSSSIYIPRNVQDQMAKKASNSD